MKERDAIGGYFESEPDREGKGFSHTDAAWLNTGRNALEFILTSLMPIRRVYIPYFTCEVIMEPFEKLGVPHTYYHINRHLELQSSIQLGEGEYLLYTNYFGVKDAYVQKLHACYGSSLIVDNAQGLFMQPLIGCKTVYSLRKFVGLPDGGLAYPNHAADEAALSLDSSADRIAHLHLRKRYGAQAGYSAFQENERKLDGRPMMRMSQETRRMISHIDFENVQSARRRNFLQLHEKLSGSNLFAVPDISTFAAPMVYPYWIEHGNELRKKLIEERVFVATYWPNVPEWVGPDSLEYGLTANLLALPIDQRYGRKEMNRILSLLSR